MSKNTPASQTSRFQLATQMVIYIVLGGLVAALVALPVVGGLGLSTRNGVRGFQSLPADLTQVPLPQQNTVVDSRNNVIASLFSQNRIEVPLNRISPLLQQAVISIEDQRFLQHSGIDLKGTLRAAFSTGSGSQVQGGSTITQQYVKQLLLAAATTPEEQRAAVEQSLGRKIREARYAMALETSLAKRDILKGYLNIAYFGAGAYGAESAARRYFSVSANELTLTQAATLAGLVQNPSRFDPTRFPQRAAARRNLVLQSMSRAGYITEAVAKVAQRQTLLDDLRPAEIPNGCTTSYAPYFCDYVLTVLKNDPVFGDTPEARARLLDLGGLTIRTTLSPKAQKSAQRAVDGRIPATDPSGKAAGITMIAPGTGKIIAMAQDRIWGTSGRGRTTVNYNVPLLHNGTTGAQAGSTFKVFTLAAALNQGEDPWAYINSYSPKTFYNFTDCKTKDKLAPYTVQNSTGSGAFNMASGTAYSVNTFFVGLEERIGLCGAPAMAKASGVQLGNGQDLPTYPCFTLGCFDVTTLDMSEAMATFAAHGMHCEPIAIAAIIDRDGNKVPVPSGNCKQVMPRQVADSVSAILSGVIDGPLGGRTGQKMSLGRPAAGKTGTTDSSAAVWFVGYTPDMAAAVWVGDPRGGQSHPMKNITINGVYYSQVFGSLMPGPIWHDAMAGALKDLPAPKWELKTLHGLAPGGIRASYGKSCTGLTGEAWKRCMGLLPGSVSEWSPTPSCSGLTGDAWRNCQSTKPSPASTTKSCTGLTGDAWRSCRGLNPAPKPTTPQPEPTSAEPTPSSSATE